MKISPEMNADLRKSVKAFNRKRQRLIQKGVSPSLLPAKASVRLLKNAYKDSETLRARLNELDSFTSKGKIRKNKKGVRGTEALFAYRKAENQAAVQRFKSDIQQIKGIKTPYKAQKQSKINLLRAKVKYLSRSVENLSSQELSNQTRNIMTPEVLYKKSMTYRRNYIDKLDEYAEIGSVDPEKLRRLKVKLNLVAPEDFYNIVNANPELTRVQDFMFDSPEGKGIKKSRPTLDPEDINDNFNDLYSRIDDILANAQVDFI